MSNSCASTCCQSPQQCHSMKDSGDRDHFLYLRLLALLFGLSIALMEESLFGLLGPTVIMSISGGLITTLAIIDFKKYLMDIVIVMTFFILLTLLPGYLVLFFHLSPLLSNIVVSTVGGLGISPYLYSLFVNNHQWRIPTLSQLTAIICAITFSLSYFSFIVPFIPNMIDDTLITVALFGIRNYFYHECHSDGAFGDHDPLPSQYLLSNLMIAMIMGITLGIISHSLITGIEALILNLMVACPCMFLLTKPIFDKKIDDYISHHNLDQTSRNDLHPSFRSLDSQKESSQQNTGLNNQDTNGLSLCCNSCNVDNIPNNHHSAALNNITNAYFHVIYLSILYDVILLTGINTCLIAGIFINPGLVCLLGHCGCVITASYASTQTNESSRSIISM
ncbi:MAG: hypothetical protein CMF42_03500 [Legionellales bacterium]|nr:hypothetical protein [Legionellales bacterium]